MDGKINFLLSEVFRKKKTEEQIKKKNYPFAGLKDEIFTQTKGDMGNLFIKEEEEFSLVETNENVIEGKNPIDKKV